MYLPLRCDDDIALTAQEPLASSIERAAEVLLAATASVQHLSGVPDSTLLPTATAASEIRGSAHLAPSRFGDNVGNDMPKWLQRVLGKARIGADTLNTGAGYPYSQEG